MINRSELKEEIAHARTNRGNYLILNCDWCLTITSLTLWTLQILRPRILVKRVYNARDRYASRNQITALVKKGVVSGYFGE
jgi:hypothetical protein